MSVLKIGLVGLGEAAQTLHLPTLFHHGDKFKVVAGQDISEKLVDQLCKKYNIVKGYTEVEDLVSDPEVDAVIIMSPDPLHFAHTKLALEQKKHVLLEKPACLQSEHIDELAKLADKYKLTMSVAYMRVFSEAFIKAEKKLKYFGDIKSVRVRDLQREGDYYIPQSFPIIVPDDYKQIKIEELKYIEFQQRKHILKEYVDCDLLWKVYRVLTGAAIHNLSALRMLIGKPKRVVSGYCNNTGDNIVLTLDYGDFFASYEILIDNIARVDSHIELTSENEMMRVNYTTPYIRNLPTTFEYQKTEGEHNTLETYGPFYKDQFTNEIMYFYQQITLGKENKTTLAESMFDIELVQQAIQCIGKNVEI